MFIGGWQKDPYDRRDYIYKAAVPVTFPDIIDLTRYLPRNPSGRVLVRDQGNIGSCTGHSKALALCTEATKLGIWPDQDYEWFSPTWIYNGARFIEGTLPFDLGAYPRDCLQWLLDNGTLLEHFWPYNPTKLDRTAPGSTRMAQAVKYTDFAYQRVADGVDGILAALNEGHIVSLGAPWTNKWMTQQVEITGVLPEVASDDFEEGGHDTCIVKADQPNRVFIGMNSWSDNWGGSFGIEGVPMGGFYSMPFSAIEVFKQAGGYDAHVITFEKTALPPEPIPPDPSKPGCLFGQLGKFFQAGG